MSIRLAASLTKLYCVAYFWYYEYTHIMTFPLAQQRRDRTRDVNKHCVSNLDKHVRKPTISPFIDFTVAIYKKGVRNNIFQLLHHWDVICYVSWHPSGLYLRLINVEDYQVILTIMYQSPPHSLSINQDKLPSDREIGVPLSDYHLCSVVNIYLSYKLFAIL